MATYVAAEIPEFGFPNINNLAFLVPVDIYTWLGPGNLPPDEDHAYWS